MILGHFALFVLSLAVIWFFSGRLVDSIDRMAHRLHTAGFRIAFFVLGVITSISEFSVMVNATIGHVPSISAGNLAGSSTVIFLLVIPFLAIRNNGIKLAHTLTKGQFLVGLTVVFLPLLFMADGVVTINEGILCLLVYIALIYVMHPRFGTGVLVHKPTAEEVGIPSGKLDAFTLALRDVLGLVVSGVLIFFAARILISETQFFALLFDIPGSFIAMLILGVGTNIPELVIVMRAIEKKHADIAFGNYLGSAITNTPLFGMLVLFNGRFELFPPEFSVTAIIAGIGLAAFYWFARSKNMLSRMEGWILIAIYVVFVIFQFYVVAG